VEKNYKEKYLLKKYEAKIDIIEIDIDIDPIDRFEK